MTNVFPKYIIEDGRLIIGKVTYHKQLAIDVKKVKGGGWYKIQDASPKMIIVFYNQSEDFGKATLEDVKQAVLSNQVFSNPFSDDSIADQFIFGYDTGTEILELNSSNKDC